MGAGGLGGPASGVGLRPGMGAGGAGGPASGLGVQPGMGYGRPGVGAGGVGGPASGLGVLPGAGFGRAGVPAAYGGAFYASTGTYYASDEAIAAQAEAVNDSVADYAPYTVASTVAAPAANAPAPTAPVATDQAAAAPVEQDAAWHPTNLTAPSIYAKPAYGEMVGGLGSPAQPHPYDFGGNVVIQADGVYVNGVFVGAPQVYADEASQIAAAGAAAEPAPDTKWLPLGVFAIVEGGATSSNDVFELAIDRQGVIRGNYQNVQAGQLTALSGSLDKQSQRAAWTIGSDQLPVYEAGIANLTKDATPILVHLPDGQSHQMTLIRLVEPQ